VREALFELSRDPKLEPAVRQATTEMLRSQRWRGLEQASLLAGALDHEAEADRLIELLDFPRPEVMVAAAWALRRLAVPATLGPMFDKVRRASESIHGAARDKDPSPIELLVLDRQTSQLIQAFGQMRYAAPEALLRTFVPKGGAGLGGESRAAAIWTLGLLHEGQPEPELVERLRNRVADVENIDDPEDERVRNMAAVSLGRMKAVIALPDLRLYYQMGHSHCGWAVEHITGETLPPVPPVEARQTGWFLEPMD
jgi:HEAT repeat protein